MLNHTKSRKYVSLSFVRIPYTKGTSFVLESCSLTLIKPNNFIDLLLINE